MSKKSNAFYERVFTEHTPGGIFEKWCWPAFFLGTLWLAYRKVYKPILYFALLNFGLQIFESISEITGFLSVTLIKAIDAGWMCSVAITVGYYGVSLYGKEWVQNKVPHDQHTSYLLAIVYFLSFLFVSILIEIIISTLFGQDINFEF